MDVPENGRKDAGPGERRAYQEFPAAWEMMSYTTLVSRSALAPSAMASAAAAMCTPASSWFTIFTPLHHRGMSRGLQA